MTNAAAPHAFPVIDQPFPGEAARPPFAPRDPARNCYIVLGNHQSYSGIVEMVHALHATFSRHYPTYVSQWLVPGAINVVIDEFAKPAMVDLMRQVRASHPQTRIVVMATEFITPMAPRICCATRCTVRGCAESNHISMRVMTASLTRCR